MDTEYEEKKALDIVLGAAVELLMDIAPDEDTKNMLRLFSCHRELTDLSTRICEKYGPNLEVTSEEREKALIVLQKAAAFLKDFMEEV